MRVSLPHIIVLMLFCLFTTFSFSQDGKIDSIFGINGKATFAFSNSSPSFAQATAIQKDGKIVIVGYYNYFLSTNFCVKRLMPNGAPDFSFGDSGLVVTPFFTGRGSYAISVEIQNDGKILVGGSAYRDIYPMSFALVRYNVNGSLDTSFGNNGQVLTNVNYGPFESILDLIVLNDNRIIAVGRTDLFGPSAIVAYQSNGALDSSFGNNGLSGLTGGSTPIYAVKPSSDGGFITLRGAEETQNMDFGVEKYKSTGRLDSTFGKNGRTLIDFYNNQDKPACIGVLPDNSMIVVGRVSGQFRTSWKTGIVKLKPNGIVDSSFGTNGRITHYLQSTSTTYLSATSVNFQKDGKILITTQYDFKNYSISRINSNGSLDSTFGTQGIMIVNIGLTTDSETFNNSALQTDNKLIVVGNNSNLANVYRISLFNTTEINLTKNISVVEGNSGSLTPVTFTVMLNKAATKQVKVNYHTRNLSAKSGSDYVAKSGTIAFPIGVSSKTITVNVKGDAAVEPNERFALVLSNPVNAVLGTIDSAICIIKNDDPSFSFNNAAPNNISSLSKSVKIYPNPVKEVLNIQGLSTQDKVQLSIVDVNGKVLAKRSVNSPSYTWDIKSLSAGTYFVRIESKDKNETLSFIKQ